MENSLVDVHCWIKLAGLAESSKPMRLSINHHGVVLFVDLRSIQKQKQLLTCSEDSET